MYMLNRIRTFSVASGGLSCRGDTQTHLLWVIESGRGWLTDGRSRQVAKRGDCVLLRPGSAYALLPSNEDGPPQQPLGGLEIAFDYLEESEPEPSSSSEPLGARRFIRKQAPFRVDGLVPSVQARESVVLALRLGNAANESKPVTEPLAVLFQRLIHLLLELQPALPSETEESAVSRTVQYMHRHYDEELTRDRLASAAGLSPWYYSNLFRRETGLTPTAYLNELRMRRAREQLILGQGDIREIAEHCGFRDETYFRRRFKASSGMTPLAFSRVKRARIADMSYAYVPHLLALDVIPCAAMVDRERELHRKPYHDRIEHHLRRDRAMTPEVWADHLEQLKAVAPDLIICDDGKENSTYGGELERIAPCLYIPWKSLDWRQQLLQLAAYVRRVHQAEQWLERYDIETEVARKKLKPLIGDDTILLLRVTGDRLAVYGRRNAGAVLHEDLGLSCPYDVQSIEIERIVDLSFLSSCKPDRILLVVDRTAESRAHRDRLYQSSEWLSLHAVQNRQVLPIPEMPWLEYSPLAHLWIVRHLPDLLANENTTQ